MRIRAVLLIVALLACSATAVEPITLYYWGVEQDTLYGELIQEFEWLHRGEDGTPPIKVIMGQTASMDRTSDPQRLLCAIAGGDPPDVVWFDRFAVGEWASRGAFQSLQPFLQRDLAERPDDVLTLRAEQFYPACWDEVVYKDAIYAVPSDTDNRPLLYNLDLLEKHAEALIAAGCVDPKNPTKVGPPRTWEQLKACAQILTERNDRGELSCVGFIPNFGNSWLYLYGWLNGGTFMSADGQTCTLNEPAIIEALSYMTELYDLMGGARAVNAFQTSSQGSGMDPFLSGRVAMKIDCGSFIAAMANLKPTMRFGAALPPAPEGKPQLTWTGGWAWVVPTHAKHPQEAWEFIKYLASKRAAKIRYDAGRQIAKASGGIFIPTLSARRDITEWALEEYLYKDPSIDKQYKDAMRIVADGALTARYRPVTPVGQLLWNEHVRAMDNGIYKRFDTTDVGRNAQRALDESTAVVQQALDRINHPAPYPTVAWWPIVIGYCFLVLVVAGLVYRHGNRSMQVRGYFRKEFGAGFLFASPWLIGFLVFGGGPILFSLIMSFCDYDVFSAPKFSGFNNYVELFRDDPLFYKSLWNTVYMVIGVPLGMVVGLAIALLLNVEIRGVAFYRTFFYLPAIMPAVAASILWIWIFNPQEGVLNTLLAHLGLAGPAWLQDQNWSKPALILMGLWGAGGGMVVWIAGLKGIPAHLYEAARLDGAGPIRCFWNITLPMLSPYLLFNLIMGLIGTFQLFTQAYIMTQGGPVDSTLFYTYGLFNYAFRYMRMGYASAMAWVLFAIVLILTVIQLRLSKQWVHYESNE